MVTELEKISLEESLKQLNNLRSQNQNLPTNNGNTYGQMVTVSDMDARLIHTLGNESELIKAGAAGLIQGETFTINGTSFYIDAVGTNVLSGFEGAVIINLSNNEKILWADGSKSFNNIFTTDGEFQYIDGTKT